MHSQSAFRARRITALVFALALVASCSGGSEPSAEVDPGVTAEPQDEREPTVDEESSAAPADVATDDPPALGSGQVEPLASVEVIDRTTFGCDTAEPTLEQRLARVGSFVDSFGPTEGLVDYGCALVAGVRVSSSLLHTAVLPDGRVVALNDDDELIVVDVEDPSKSVVLTWAGDRTRNLIVLRDGRIAARERGALRIFDWDDPSSVIEHSLVDLDDPDEIIDLGNGRIAVTGDNVVRTFMIDSPGEFIDDRFDDDRIRAIAALADGRLAVVSNQQIHLWTPGEPDVSRFDYEPRVFSMVGLDDGTFVTSGHELAVWDPTVSTPLVTQPRADDWFLHSALPNGLFATRGRDGVVVWDAATLEPRQIARRSGTMNGSVLSAPDGRLITGEGDGLLRLWDLSQADSVSLGHTGDITDVASIDRNRFASASTDGTVRVWDLERPLDPLVMTGHDGSVGALTVLPDGAIVSGGVDGSIRLWDVETGLQTDRFDGHQGEILGLAGTEGVVVSAGDDRTVRLWKLDDGSNRVIGTHDDRVVSVAVLLDGRIASVSDDLTLRVWSLDGVEERQFELSAEPNVVYQRDEDGVDVETPEGSHSYSFDDFTFTFSEGQEYTDVALLADGSFAAVDPINHRLSVLRAPVTGVGAVDWLGEGRLVVAVRTGWTILEMDASDPVVAGRVLELDQPAPDPVDGDLFEVSELSPDVGMSPVRPDDDWCAAVATLDANYRALGDLTSRGPQDLEAGFRQVLGELEKASQLVPNEIAAPFDVELDVWRQVVALHDAADWNLQQLDTDALVAIGESGAAQLTAIDEFTTTNCP